VHKRKRSMLISDLCDLFGSDDDDNVVLHGILGDSNSDSDSGDLPLLVRVRLHRLSTGRSCAAHACAGDRLKCMERKSVRGASSSGDRLVKRSRASLHDVQLGKAMSDSLAQVAESAAELRVATAVKVCDSQIATRDRMLTVAERIAKEDMEMHKDSMKMYKDAMESAHQATDVVCRGWNEAW
jgi:hypothetical protein